MSERISKEVQKILNERFNHDVLISIATVDDGVPYVRTVNSYYENKKFYVVTHGLSNKMKQIQKSSKVAICGEWFTAHGIGENLGCILDEKNEELACKLRKEFAQWYYNGHTDESDPNTCILCIHLTDGVLYSHGKRYEIDFSNTHFG